MKHNLKVGIAVTAVATVMLAGAGFGTAQAAKLITSEMIKDGTITTADLSNGVNNKLDKKAEDGKNGKNGKDGKDGKDGAQGPAGEQGPAGPAGAKGDTGPAGATGATGATGAAGSNGLLNAYYSVAYYNVGDTNAGAIATVACSNTTDVAISGGVQTLGAGGTNAAVGDSFPGRMDWSTNTPRPNRLDGWVIQFDADQPPLKTKIWALCVPGASIPVVSTYTQSTS